MNKLFVRSMIILGVLAIFSPILGQTTLLFSESFEGSWPPSGWIIQSGGGQNQWKRNDMWGRPNYAGAGYCADNDDAGAGPGAVRVTNNELITPNINAGNYTTVKLAYDYDWYPDGTGMQGRVLVFNGSSWNIVRTFMAGGRSTGRDSLDVSTHLAGVANGKVSFLYTETTGGVKSFWFEIDGVRVWGSDPPVPLDLEMVSIIRPRSREIGGMGFNPTCQIYNNADSITHPTVTCLIYRVNEAQPIYEDVQTNYNLAPGYSTVSFEPFVPDDNSSYTSRFTVSHPDDANSTNNSLQKGFTTVNIDVTPFLRELPEIPEQFTPFEPTAYYTERNGDLVLDVEMRCWIRVLVTDSLVYYDTLEKRTFSPHDTVMAVFDTAYLDVNTYVISFWAADQYGINISNPTLIDTFDYVGIIETNPEKNFMIHPVFPNPCRETISINYSLDRTSNVELNIYDIAGNIVATPVSGGQSAGSHQTSWDASNLSTGVYFVRLSAGNSTDVKKVLVIH